MLLLAIHHDFQGTVEADVAHKLGFLNGRHTIEDGLLQHTIASIGVDGEVADTKGGEVLEEMGALRGVYMIVLQASLNNDTSGRDMGPLDGDAQPIVAGAPTSWTDEDVVLVLVQETTVNLLYLVGNGGIVGSGEVVIGLDIDNIHHVF